MAHEVDSTEETSDDTDEKIRTNPTKTLQELNKTNTVRFSKPNESAQTKSVVRNAQAKTLKGKGQRTCCTIF